MLDHIIVVNPKLHDAPGINGGVTLCTFGGLKVYTCKPSKRLPALLIHAL